MNESVCKAITVSNIVIVVVILNYSTHQIKVTTFPPSKLVGQSHGYAYNFRDRYIIVPKRENYCVIIINITFHLDSVSCFGCAFQHFL